MAGERELADGLAEFERSLRSLAPKSTVDRDRLIFLAGRMSAGSGGRRRGGGHWLWPAATACSTLCTAVLAAVLVLRPFATEDQGSSVRTEDRGSRIEDRVAAVDRNADREAKTTDSVPTVESKTDPRSSIVDPRPPSAPRISNLDRDRPANYLHLRDLVLAEGIEAWPARNLEDVRDTKRSAEPRSALRAGDRLRRGEPSPALEFLFHRSERSTRGATL